MEDSDIHEKLFDASRDGNNTRVRELLAAGADPNKYRNNDRQPIMVMSVTYNNAFSRKM